MIYGFFFHFLKVTNSRWLSIILAYIVRLLFICRYIVTKITLKRHEVTLGLETAKQILTDSSPDPKGRPCYKMVDPKKSVDLSVIVPIYNNKDMTVKCINTILDQKTRYCYELILIDDGSTDGIQNLIDTYTIQKNVFVIHQNNEGIAGARNTGIENSHGRYIMFIDCDDIVHEDLIDSLLNKAYSCNADIAMCAHNLVKMRDGVEISRLPNIYPKINMLGYQNEAKIMNYAGLPWGKVYRRELWEKVRFFPGYWYEDNIIHGLIFPQCRIFAYLPEIKYEYIWHDTNFSHIQNKKQNVRVIENYWLLLSILERYEELSLPQGASFYTMLLRHLSAYYYPVAKELPYEVIEAMFVVGRELVLKYRPIQTVRLPYMLKETEKAFLNNNIDLWILCSVNQ